MPFPSHEEVKKAPWESTLPGSSFDFKTGTLLWGLSPRQWSLKKAVAVTLRAAGVLTPAS